MLARLSARLDRGEIEVILLAREVGGTAIIDERKSRREASQLGLNVSGTLGLIQHGVERGWLSDAEALDRAAQLRAHGFALPQPARHARFAGFLGQVG